MFQNAYQGGSFLEVYDAKANKEKDKNLVNLYRMTTPQGYSKVFDKDIKGYIFTIDGHSTKMRFPKDDRVDLCIVQHYLVLQIYLPYGSPWNLEVGISDTAKVNRRINLVSALNKTETKYFHVKVPNDIIKRGVWMNLSIDVNSFMEAWKGSTFRSIDNVTIGSVCKLRRVYTMKAPLFEMSSDNVDEDIIEQLQHTQKPEEAPRAFAYPPGFPHINQVITYQRILDNVDPKYASENTQQATADSMVDVMKQSRQKGTATMKSTSLGTQQPLKTLKKTAAVGGNQEEKGPMMTSDFQMKSMKMRQEEKTQQISSSARQVPAVRSPLVSKNQQPFQADEYDSRDFEVSQTSSKQSPPQPALKAPPAASRAPAVATSKRAASREQPVNGRSQGKLSTTSSTTAVKGEAQSSSNPWVVVSNAKTSATTTASNRSRSDSSRQVDSSSTIASSKRPLGHPVREEEEDDEEIEESLEKEEEEEEYYDSYEPEVRAPPTKQQQMNGKAVVPSSSSSKAVQSNTSSSSSSGQSTQEKRFTKSANGFGQPLKKAITTTKGGAVEKKAAAAAATAATAAAGKDSLGMTNTSDLNEESYFQLTQKFNTISDPNQFRDIFSPPTLLPQKTKGKIDVTSSSVQDDGIEEDIEVERAVAVQQYHNPSKQQQPQKATANQKQATAVDKNNGNFSFEDSLEIPSKHQPPTQHHKSSVQKRISTQHSDAGEDSLEAGQLQYNYNIYENHLNKFISPTTRPFTPPFSNSSVVPLSGHSVITKKNNNTVVIKSNPNASEQEGPGVQYSSRSQSKMQGQENSLEYDRHERRDSLEVIYDPVLNCYYDPQTKQYYELKQ